MYSIGMCNFLGGGPLLLSSIDLSPEIGDGRPQAIASPRKNKAVNPRMET